MPCVLWENSNDGLNTSIKKANAVEKTFIVMSFIQLKCDTFLF